MSAMGDIISTVGVTDCSSHLSKQDNLCMYLHFFCQKNATAIPHMYSKLAINVMTDEVSFERMSIPSDIFHLMQ